MSYSHVLQMKLICIWKIVNQGRGKTQLDDDFFLAH